MQNEQLILSVVIPVSRMAGKLELFKEWVLSSQERAIFLIIVHDWRDKETELELVEFLSKLNQKRFIYISGEYGSPGHARNAGLSSVLSNWVTFWDSDDVPDVESALRAIEESSSDDEVLIGSFETIDANKSVTGRYILSNKWQMCVAKNPGMWRMIFRKNVLGKMVFSDLLMGEDQLFLIQNRIFDRRVRVSTEVFYSYQTMQDEQATRTKKSLTDLIRCLELFHHEVVKVDGVNKPYYQIMYIKQCISAITHLKVKNKAKAISKLWLFMKENGILATFKIFVRIVNE